MTNQRDAAEARKLLAQIAGYEISKRDAESNCSVLAKHAVEAMLQFASLPAATKDNADG